MPRDYAAIGKKAAETNRKRHGPDFYSRIAKKSYAKRKSHYHHFSHLAETDPEQLKQFGRDSAKARSATINNIKEK